MNNKEARKIAQMFVERYGDQLAGAFLFGSTIEGKPYPNDVDTLLIKKEGARLNFREFPYLDNVNYIAYSERYAREMQEKDVGDYKFYRKVIRTGERLL